MDFKGCALCLTLSNRDFLSSQTSFCLLEHMWARVLRMSYVTVLEQNWLAFERDSLIRIVTGLCAGYQGNHASIPSRVKCLSRPWSIQAGPRAYLVQHSMNNGSSFHESEVVWAWCLLILHIERLICGFHVSLLRDFYCLWRTDHKSILYAQKISWHFGIL